MINFFRKIRQRLLTENKFTRYLPYALGEIFLVVIGILIALQINNWNENRKLRLQEVKYLKRVQSDLLAELENNAEMMVHRSEKAKAASLLLSYPKPYSVDEFKAFAITLDRALFWEAFLPTNNTYKELLSSGNLNIISNDSLKNCLLELDKMYTTVSNNENHMRREYEHYLYDPSTPTTSISLFIDFEGVAETGTLYWLNEKDITDEHLSRMSDDFEWIKNSKIMENGLKLAVANNLQLEYHHLEIDKLLKKTNSIINDELVR